MHHTCVAMSCKRQKYTTCCPAEEKIEKTLLIRQTAQIPGATALQDSCCHFFLLFQQFYVLFVSPNVLNAYYFTFAIYCYITMRITLQGISYLHSG